MSTGANAVTRDVDNGGGTFSSTANNQLTGSASEDVALTTAGTAANLLRSGFSTIAYYPGTLASLTMDGGVTTSSATLQWATPGYDGGLGAALGGSAYLVQVASSSTYGNLSSPSVVNVTVSTSAQAVGKIVGTGLSGLDPNTTYYAQVMLRDNDGDVGGAFTTALTTFTTLATPPTVGALEFLSVQPSSITVAWIAPSEVSVSSKSNEGYVLMASSDDFGATGAPVFSSTTYSALASTLTISVGPGGEDLDLSSTYYFRVASLNWIGQSSATAFTRLNFQIQPSASLIHLGAMDPSVARSTVSTSSMVVTNLGNWPATIELSASTATAGGSPWGLGAAPGVETAVLQGVFNPGTVGPAPSAFSTLITGSTLAATSANYAGGYDAVQIPPGQSRTLWFYFTMPTSSSSLGPEKVEVLAQPIYP